MSSAQPPEPQPPEPQPPEPGGQQPAEPTGGRRGPSRAVVLSGVVIGGLVAFACSGRTWRVGNGGTVDPVTGVVATATIAGTEIVPGVRACALATLAGVVALLLVRGRLRVVVAAVVTVVAGVATALALGALFSVPAHLRSTAWVWLTVAAALLATVAAAVATATCRAWSSTRSTRYDAPGVRHDERDDPWQALDRGDDPTL